MCSDATARERYQWTSVGVVLRQMRRARYCADDAGSYRLAIASLQLVLPVAVGLDLIDEDGALLASMSRKIALTVSIKIQTAHTATALDRILRDRGVDSATLPLDIARESDVHR
jgi:DNA-binding IclR family transcriptional regulator